jgi:biotin carboxyl carrier protein
MIKKLRVTVDGNTYDVTVELPDDASAPASAVDPVSVPVAPAAPASTPTAPAASTPPPPPAAAAAPAGTAQPGDVPSPLAGRVTAVVVKVGQEVKEGDHLLTLEAMKMNTFVFAPKAGKVADLKVTVGDAVEEGQAMARIQ